VIQGQQAATITQAWVALEQQFGEHATSYMRKTVEPAIRAAAQEGRNAITIDGVSPKCSLVNCKLALASPGYKTQLNSSRFAISW